MTTKINLDGMTQTELLQIANDALMEAFTSARQRPTDDHAKHIFDAIFAINRIK